MRLQRTLKQEVSFGGIGLHTGAHVYVKLKPAPRDTGIVFIRTDKNIMIHANINAVSDTAFATTLGSNGTRVKTVEHFLAACSGLGIDNIIVELSGSEMPILDGSSTNIIDIILKAGIAKQGKKRPYIRIIKPLMFEEGHSNVAIFPYEGRKITYRIEYHHKVLGEQIYTLELNEESFAKEIAPARTYGFLRDVEYLRANGLAKGGSLDNAVILSDEGILNKTGLRFKDEFVRHKILDLIGDFSLAGFPIYGHIMADRSGHSTNIKFIKKLLASTECWELVADMESSEAVAYT